jgi:transposase
LFDRNIAKVCEETACRRPPDRLTARVIGLEAEYAAMAARGAAVPQDDGADSGSRMRPKRQRRTAMEYFAGLDVAMEETAICVIDREGKVVLETMVTTDPDAIAKVLKPYLSKLRRAGHEAGSLSPWLQVELKQRGVPAICLEAWHARAALSAMRNKTDKADARGIAHIMRAGWFREVHIKSEESYRLWLLLTQRRNLKRKFLDIENTIRHSIKTFGLRIGRVGRGQFEERVRELVADDPLVAGLTDCMLRARAALWQEYDQTTEEFMARQQCNDRPIRRAR